MQTLSYQGLANELNRLINSGELDGDEEAVIIQTDNVCRQIRGVQTGVGGCCLLATRDRRPTA